MRLLIIVPTIAHKATAGSRIRYGRLEDFFDISLRSLEDVSAQDIDACNICILSKTYSVEAIAIACQMRNAGKLVGVDVFDDYFTQTRDSRLLKFRRWLQLFSKYGHFAVCSTPTLRCVIEHAAPELSVHLLPDPFPNVDLEEMKRVLAAKRARLEAERVLDILWFGIGSNPFFPAGLRDLSAYSSSLRELASSGFKPRLTILTNRSALTPQHLAQLGRIPVEHRIEIWSLETEGTALRQAFVAFLPVNGQSFSRAKSLNRAVTAISSGAQILSPGFPLYASLDPAIYSEASELAADIAKGACRIREDTLPQIGEIVSQASSVESAASSFFLFLCRQLQANRKRASPTGEMTAAGKRGSAVIHGPTEDKRLAKALKEAGVISVRSPFALLERAYDIRIERLAGRRMAFWITPPMKAHLANWLTDKCAEPERKGKLSMSRILAENETELSLAPAIDPSDRRPVIRETVAYRAIMRDIERICARIFPGLHFFFSDIEAYGESDAPIRDARE